MEENDDYVPYVPIKQRRLEKLHKYATQRRVTDSQNEDDNEDEDVIVAGPKAHVSLLDQTVQQKLANLIPGNKKRYFQKDWDIDILELIREN